MSHTYSCSSDDDKEVADNTFKTPVKQEEENANNPGEWPHQCVMSLIDIMQERKINRKTYKTLGSSTWKRIALQLQKDSGKLFPHK